MWGHLSQRDPPQATTATCRGRTLWRSAARGAILLLALAGSTLWPQDSADPKAIFQKLNEASIDPSQVYVIRNAKIVRDRVSLYLNRGVIGFLTSVRGEVTGAYFAGDGEVLLMPPDPIEKFSLKYFTRSAILEEQFTAVYLRFTDKTAGELITMAARPEPGEPLQTAGFASEWDPIVRELSPRYSARILMDLLGDRAKPCFNAYVFGAHLGVFQVEVDDRMPEAVRVWAVRQSQTGTFADLWCSFPSQKSRQKAATPGRGPFRVKSYKIDTRIDADNSLGGQAELEIESGSASDRVISLDLSRQLHVDEAHDEAGRRLTVFENPSPQETEGVRRSSDWIVVVLDHAQPVGRSFRLQLSYHGNVITDVGNGVLYVGDRGSWYPNLGLTNRALYDLKFHFPDRLTLVATGERVEERENGGWKHSHWISRQPIAVAGFNLGAYHWRERKAGSITVEAFATREVEADLEKRNVLLESMTELMGRRGGGIELRGPLVARPAPPLDPAALLDRVTDVAAETVTRYESLFGPISSSRLAISQIPGHFGQGWPGLVYLPTLSFLPRGARLRLGFDSKSERISDELTLAHEIAHQWWGNEVGWQTYRDQWLSEGFSTYSAVLQMATGKDGERKLHELLQNYKADLLSKTLQGDTIESGGPIVLGQRLSNSLNPNGYPNIIYKKSCWVIHMLRCLMSESTPGRDERFIKMLRDFLVRYKGQDPSTQDFIRHAEKYMTPSMDLEHNRELDWFFDDWVYGTGIPTYKLGVNVRRTAPKKYIAEGTIEQSGVPAGFEMPVPVVAHYSKERKSRLGWVVVGDTGGKFRFTVPEKPARLTIDEDSILAVVK